MIDDNKDSSWGFLAGFGHALFWIGSAVVVVELFK